MKFIEYNVTADKLCVGERNKGGRYKPTSDTLRYSQLVGALTSKFGDHDFHAVGHLHNYQKEFLSYNLRDRYSEKVKVPLKVQFMTKVKGKAFITCSNIFYELQKDFYLNLGAMISKGFGECAFKFLKEIDIMELPVSVGILKSRIPIRANSDSELSDLIESGKTTEFLKSIFGIEKIIKPVFGYLFKPVNQYTGYYELSLFEGSKIESHIFLL